jgi:NDP-sugar pyrophosphorylase family protein
VLSGKVRLRILGEQRSEGLWTDRGVRILPTANLQGQVVMMRDAVVGRRVPLIGDVTLGSACRVRTGATIKRSVLLPPSSVGAGAYPAVCIVGHDYNVRADDDIRDGALVRRCWWRIALPSKRTDGVERDQTAYSARRCCLCAG